MKSVLIKDTFREIRHTLGRFLAIFAIVALGSGFFAGIKATMPDMVDTASQYFKDNKLMDLKLVSTIGVRSSDVEKVKKAENVKGVHAAYSKDVFYYNNNQNLVLKCISFNRTLKDDNPNLMNKLVVLKGRLPENGGECAVEVKMASPDTFKLGNTLTFAEPDKTKKLTDTLAHEDYKIVGIVTSPCYIGYERDVTDVGNGTIVSNVFLAEEEFVCDYYTEMFVDLDIDQDLDPFSDKYRSQVEKKGSQAIEIFEKSIGERYDKLMADAQKKIDSSRSLADTVGGYLAMDQTQLGAAKVELTLQLDSAKAEYERLDAISKNSPQALLAKSAMLKIRSALDVINELIGDLGDLSGEAHTKYLAQVDQAYKEIDAAVKELEGQKDAAFYTFNRFTASDDYSSFEGDSRKIDSIAKVFPVFFILVAALVCLTTMTRMVEEQRSMIGVYKALGYSGAAIAGKYLCYSITAAASGSIIGSVIGLKIFPAIIYNSYRIMYDIPYIETKIRPTYVLGCLVVSVGCIGLTVLYACIRELKAVPSTLMRPKPPKNGKRVWLEKFPKIWSRLSFLSKVTLRNLLRYKKRFAMTVMGVVGCTALIITGFGLKHSISTIVSKQFDEVFVYDGLVVTNSDYTYEQLDRALDSVKEIGMYMQAQLSDVQADANGNEQTVSVCVPDEPERFRHFVDLRDIDTDKGLTVAEDTAIITQKLSMLLDLKKGDTLTLTDSEGNKGEVKIAGISKNYAMHYVYITRDTYHSIFGKKCDYNIAFVDLLENTDHNSFKEKLISHDEFYGMSYKTDSSKGFLNSVDSLDSVVILLIVCAGLLAIVVLYNLANINITERLREIATVKVLGFYDSETTDYILRENYISAAVGILIGCLVGKALHHFVVLTAEVDLVMFNRSLVWWAYLYGSLMTLGFTLAVNLMLHLKLKKVDMVESLKSVE